MTNTELLTEPELTPILEAYFDTEKAFKKASSDCRAVYLSLGRNYQSEPEAELTADIAAFEQTAEQNLVVAELGRHLLDFVKMGVDEMAGEYITARYRYQHQQREIANRPYLEWQTAYNARLAEIDSQIRGAKIRRGKLWGKVEKGLITVAQNDILWQTLSAEIDALEARREIVAADKFESVAA
jgi:hypothetical protein